MRYRWITAILFGLTLGFAGAAAAPALAANSVANHALHAMSWHPGKLTSAGSELKAGHSLQAGHKLVSPNRQYKLIMQTDGNLVEYTQGHALWQSKTAGNPGARVVMQTDGNLVVYLGSTPLWQSHTGGHAAAAFYLSVQNDANLVIYTPSGSYLWASNTTRTGGACNAFSGAYQLSNGGTPTAYSDPGLVVPACGPLPGQNGGPAVHPYPGSLATPGYQCVEFAERYLYYQYGVTMGIGTNGDQVVAHYGAQYPSLFSVIANGAVNQAPVQGDVLSFSTTPSFNSGTGGHTAVVESSGVNAAGNGSITIVEENAVSSGVQVLTVNSWVVTYPGLPYIEWLHAH